ncbi:MAG: ATP-binding protein [Bacteroidota bacterium]
MLRAENGEFTIQPDTNQFSISRDLLIFEDLTNQLNIHQISERGTEFKKFDNNISLKRDRTYWAKITIKNKSVYHRWVLSPDWNRNTKRNSLIEIYLPPDNTPLKIGRLLPYSQKEGISRRLDNNQILLMISPSEEQTIYIKIWQIDGKPPVLDVQLMEYAYWNGEKKEFRNLAQAFFQGILWIMLIYALVNYIALKDDAYLYYAIFLLALSIFFLYLSGILLETILREIPTYSYYFWALSTNFVVIGYFQFARSFLKTKRYIPNWDKVGKGFIIFMLVWTIVEFLVLYTSFNQDFLNKLNNLILLSESIFLLSAAVIYINSDYGLARSFSFGTICVVTAAIIGIGLDTFGLTQQYLPLIGFFFILQIVAFSWGLSKRNRVAREQRLQKEIESESLKELYRIKSRFFANISHEFRSPLTIIKGSIDELKKEWMKAGNNEFVENLKHAERNSSSLLRLVNQILDLSKLESNSMPLNWKHGDIIIFINYIFESFSSYAKSKQVALSKDFELEALEMDFDPDSLQSILSNLLSNALKFTPSGGEVNLQLEKQVREDKDYLRIIVSDSGIGIKEEELPYIFMRYYQSKDQTEQKLGTGIGLALVKEQLSLLKGDISVQSEEGKGTTFEILLPIFSNYKDQDSDIRAMHLDTIEVPIPTKPEVNQKINKGIADYENDYILLMEDDAEIIAYLQSILAVNYRIGVARNGADGIELAFQTVPDLIISDVMMPEKDGYEVCEQLKADVRSSHIPIILLTGRASQEDRLAGFQKGADAYLNKPFNKQELLVRIEQLIAQRKKLQEVFSKGGIKVEENEKEHVFVAETRRLIVANLDNEEFDIESLCKHMGMSYTQFYRKLKALTNKTASIFIREVRLEKGYQLLKEGELNISEIAYDIGFKDPAYFSRVFSEKYGLPPSAMKP